MIEIELKNLLDKAADEVSPQEVIALQIEVANLHDDIEALRAKLAQAEEQIQRLSDEGVQRFVFTPKERLELEDLRAQLKRGRERSASVRNKDEVQKKLKRSAIAWAVRKYGKHQQGVAFHAYIAGAAWALRLIQKQISIRTLKR